MKTSRFLGAAILLAAAPLSAVAQSTLLTIPAFDTTNLNRKVRACDDFYEFANGGWLNSHPIPAAFSSWGGFADLSERNNLVLKSVLEDAAKRAPTTNNAATKKLGTFYASCMDSTAAETAGITPLKPELARIDAISNRTQLLSELARLHKLGFGGAFRFGGSSDNKNANMVIAEISQGGLTLPDRDQYLKSDDRSKSIRAKYVDNVTKLFTLAGESAPAALADAKRILDLETALAKVSLPRTALRDPKATYHPMTIAEANAITPAIDWAVFMREAGGPSVPSLNVAMPEFFKALSSEVANRPLDDWKAYFRWQIIGGSAPQLSSAFANQAFSFSSMLSGATQQLPRWRRCLSLADRSLSDALGQEYVKVAFTSQAKAKMLDMVLNLRAVLRDRILHAAWMSEDTRKQALQKLDAFNQKIGYPDKWENYSNLNIASGAFINNALAVQKYQRAKGLSRIGKPVDRTEWGMTTPTVNAYYNPPLNEVVFPAGRLQPPFFAMTYDDPENYGGVGISIGHEMSHGFDDEGRQYDAQGNVRDWWTAEDATRYTTRANVVEQQYGGYVAVDTLHLNGKLTLGENLADVVGVSIAYDAMERAMKGKPHSLINGFTPEQRFFLAAAQARMANTRPERARILVATDPHSPGKYRVNGPFSNMPEFATAWGCKSGDPMVRPDSIRARIW
ncbi:MAG: M13 family metallopeptidase [Gemmatimonadaceae bacterium]|nr:M13 family metallopeptidase [Gemmatimonadaceae bacterium]